MSYTRGEEGGGARRLDNTNKPKDEMNKGTRADTGFGLLQMGHC